MSTDLQYMRQTQRSPLEQHEKLELASGGENLGQVKIIRGIFQGDSLLSLLVICLIPLTFIFHLSKVKASYEFGKSGPGVNHLLYKDDRKVFI